MKKEAYQQQYWTCNTYGWMGGIKCNGGQSWNVALVTWRVVNRKDHVDTAKDDDEFNGVRAYIFDERCSTAMDDTGALDSMHAAAILQPRMKDDYAGGNKEYNDTIIPVASIGFTRILVNSPCCPFIILVC
ncbi:predicted protein [Lichtheimia corymbifera JMRC:FSU:9682]|uniref:Uncharacterized protein n=1 Tax=Lichtheimia corymbifera JMRC:FSU:9682 TaxID=1263082 RepID=A0A068RI37_9FUNG|nr:predicted protein [Lichtheimia corymbifera JMRC:FSU:9682]